MMRLLTVTLMGALWVLSGCASCPEGTSRIKGGSCLTDLDVALVTAAGFTEPGLFEEHERLRAAFSAQQAFSTTFLEVGQPNDVEEAIPELAESGHDVVIFSTGTWGYDFSSLIEEFPQIRFLSREGATNGTNAQGFAARNYQAMYLAGMTAADASCTGRLGVIGTVPSPYTVRQINAFVLGAQEINPGVLVQVDWIGSWYDPVSEQVYIQNLLGNQDDVILSLFQTTTALDTVYMEETVQCEGQVSPAMSIANFRSAGACEDGGVCLTSIYYNWGPTLIEVIGEMRKNTWDGTQPIWLPMQVDPQVSPLALDPLSEVVSSDGQQRVAAALQSLEVGPVATPFIGPLTDTLGNERVAAGIVLDDDQLTHDHCWFVQGIVDEQNQPAEVPAECSAP